MKYDIESKLNTVTTQLDTIAMTETEKNTMWRRVEAGMNKKTTFAFSAIRTRIRAAVALTLVVLFAGSSVAFAYADSAKPGDVLFPLGVAREKVEIFLAPESKKNDLRVKFAEKRIEDGQVFLTLLVKAKGTYADSYASTTATTTATTVTAISTATTTTTNTATENATRRFHATIAYLEGVKSDLLGNGDTLAAGALQDAIDAMIVQAQATSTNDSVLVKIKDNANKFKMDVRIVNSTTTTKISVSERTKEPGNGKKGEHKKDEREDRDEDKGKHDDNDDGDEREEKGFLGLFGEKATVCHTADDQKKTISIGKSAIKAHLAHGDTLGECGMNGTATTTPDTVAPTISDLSAALITSSSATVYWNTNESATGKVKYGTTTPLSNILENTALSLTHSFSLTGLVASTTYRYIVSSTDGAGNTATSGELIFTTP